MCHFYLTKLLLLGRFLGGCRLLFGGLFSLLWGGLGSRFLLRLGRLLSLGGCCHGCGFGLDFLLHNRLFSLLAFFAGLADEIDHQAGVLVAMATLHTDAFLRAIFE